MTRPDHLPLFLLLLLLLQAAPVCTARSAELRIIYSNDVRGELEPCG